MHDLICSGTLSKAAGHAVACDEHKEESWAAMNHAGELAVQCHCHRSTYAP